MTPFPSFALFPCSTGVLLNIHAGAFPPLLDKNDKVIQHARPGSILAPPAHCLVFQRLSHEDGRLLPHVLVNALAPSFLQIGDPPV